MTKAQCCLDMRKSSTSVETTSKTGNHKMLGEEKFEKIVVWNEPFVVVNVQKLRKISDNLL